MCVMCVSQRKCRREARANAKERENSFTRRERVDEKLNSAAAAVVVDGATAVAFTRGIQLSARMQRDVSREERQGKAAKDHWIHRILVPNESKRQ